MIKRTLFFLTFLLVGNYNFSNDYPKFAKFLADYYFDNPLYSREMQEFRVNKLMEDLTKDYYDLFIGENFKIKKLSDKETKKIKVKWRFTRTRYSMKKDELFEAEKNPSGSYLSNFELYTPYILKEVDTKGMEIECILKLKDENIYKYRISPEPFVNFIYFNFEYFLIKTKDIAFDINELNNKRIKIKIMGMEEQIQGGTFWKHLKIYALICGVDDNF